MAGKRQSGGRPPQSINGNGGSRSASTVWRRYGWSWDVKSPQSKGACCRSSSLASPNRKCVLSAASLTRPRVSSGSGSLNSMRPRSRDLSSHSRRQSDARRKNTQDLWSRPAYCAGVNTQSSCPASPL